MLILKFPLYQSIQFSSFFKMYSMYKGILSLSSIFYLYDNNVKRAYLVVYLFILKPGISIIPATAFIEASSVSAFIYINWY